jgi:hypothetical protein
MLKKYLFYKNLISWWFSDSSFMFFDFVDKFGELNLISRPLLYFFVVTPIKFKCTREYHKRTSSVHIWGFVNVILKVEYVLKPDKLKHAKI